MWKYVSVIYDSEYSIFIKYVIMKIKWKISLFNYLCYLTLFQIDNKIYDIIYNFLYNNNDNINAIILMINILWKFENGANCIMYDTLYYNI